MPAKSKSQQRLMAWVHAYKNGKAKNAPKKIRDIAKNISDSDARDFARTKHEGLPEKKGEFSWRDFANRHADDMTGALAGSAVGTILGYALGDKKKKWKAALLGALTGGVAGTGFGIARRYKRIAENENAKRLLEQKSHKRVMDHLGRLRMGFEDYPGAHPDFDDEKWADYLVTKAQDRGSYHSHILDRLFSGIPDPLSESSAEEYTAAIPTTKDANTFKLYHEVIKRLARIRDKRYMRYRDIKYIPDEM